MDINFEDYGGFGAKHPDINTTIFTPGFLAKLDECLRAAGAFLNLHLLTDHPQDHLREFETTPLGAICFQLDAVQEPTALKALVHQIVARDACASPVVGTGNRPPLSIETAFRSNQGSGYFDHVAPYIAQARRALDGTLQIQN